MLISFVNRELGSGKPTSKNNYAYYCPFCKKSNKPKLEIQMGDDKHAWACWSCNSRGKNIVQLFRKLKISDKKISELRGIVKDDNLYDYTETIVEEKIELPAEFKSLISPNMRDIETKHVMYYLKKRNITHQDIIKYNIGFCETGNYGGRIIFPIYDKLGNLIFFDSRTYTDSSLRYLKSPYSKNIIANEHLINWGLPVILCEGMFDAIAIKRNVVPLLGKIIQPELMKMLLTSKSNKVYIVLDSDAIKVALSFCELLINEGKEVYLVEMGEEDASDMGFENFTRHIYNSEPMSYEDLLKKKIDL